jgi:predicted lysophospholipase L1 biosynthesis ABC-type transport system permease subunit
MALFGWIMMGIAIWHFTVFLPDRFWAGIIGAFVGSVIGAVFFALLIHGFDLPSQDDTNVLTILEAVPGTLIGLAAVWVIGVRQENKNPDAFGRAPAH